MIDDVASPEKYRRSSFAENILDEHETLGKSVSEVPDCDANGAYYGLSIRRGPYMLDKQEDRVSKEILTY